MAKVPKPRFGAKSPVAPPRQGDGVDVGGFPSNYSEPEEEADLEEEPEDPTEKRSRQQKFLTSMLPPQPESPSAQIHVVSKAAPKPVTSPTPESTVSKPEGTISKVEAVRRSLAANPGLTGESGSAYVKTNFGLDVNASTFANYKSTINKEARESGSGPAPKASASAPSAQKVPPAKAPSAAAQSSIIGKIRAIKELLKTSSPEEIKSLVDELAE